MLVELSLYKIFVCFTKYFPQIAERWKYSVQLPAKDASTGVSWFGGYYRSALLLFLLLFLLVVVVSWFGGYYIYLDIFGFRLILLMFFLYIYMLCYICYGLQCKVFLSDTGPNGRIRWSWLHPPTWPSCPASRMLPLQGDYYIEHIFTGNNLYWT